MLISVPLFAISMVLIYLHKDTESLCVCVCVCVCVIKNKRKMCSLSIMNTVSLCLHAPAWPGSSEFDKMIAQI